jgi:hypothetical protein
MLLKPKMRVQLFDKEGIPLSDRLVDQYTETNNGPKEIHEGVMKIEFTFTNSDEVESGISYLQQLIGKLPLKDLQKRGRKSLTDSEPKAPKEKNLSKDEKTSLEVRLANFYNELESDKVAENQKTLITWLREDCNFALTTEEALEELGIKINLKKAHIGKYQWFLRCLKLGKRPIDDKFDTTIMLGLSVIGEPNEKVVVYENLEFKKKVIIPVPEKQYIFKRLPILRFPKFMSEEDRKTFRLEHRLLLNDPNKEISKFYQRWYKDVQIPVNILPKQIEKDYVNPGK